jgi:hypothetical protein
VLRFGHLHRARNVGVPRPFDVQVGMLSHLSVDIESLRYFPSFTGSGEKGVIGFMKNNFNLRYCPT